MTRVKWFFGPEDDEERRAIPEVGAGIPQNRPRSRSPPLGELLLAAAPLEPGPPSVAAGAEIVLEAEVWEETLVGRCFRSSVPKRCRLACTDAAESTRLKENFCKGILF